MSRIPDRFCRTTSSNTDISHIINSLRKRDDKFLPFQVFKGEWLFAFKIPPFQRAVVWTDEQCVKFIESAWLGFDLGSYLINRIPWSGEFIHEYDDFLIDGLQRISAIHRYVRDELQVFGLYYSELSEHEVTRFENVQFTCNTTSLLELEQLKELYNRLNFGGTPHTEKERA